MSLSDSAVQLPSGSEREQAREVVRLGVSFLKRNGNPLRESAIGFRHLGKLGPISYQHLDELRQCFAPILPDEISCEHGDAKPSVTILGLSESGIVPSYIVKSLRDDARWFCTTRRAQPDLATFQESHSHAPTHFLPREFGSETPGELWIVEDEITTGKTLLNLLGCLPDSFQQTHVRVFSLLDARQAADKVHFDQAVEKLTLARKIVSLRCNAVFRWAEVEPLLQAPRLHLEDEAKSKTTPRLVLGEAIREALPWLDQNPNERLQHVSLSPWAVDGRYVRSCQTLGRHHLYNWDVARPPRENDWFDCSTRP